MGFYRCWIQSELGNQFDSLKSIPANIFSQYSFD